jgi:hypothetical protein
MRAPERHPEGGRSAILDAAATMVTDVLTHRGFMLAAPVGARFRTAEHRSSGVEIMVRLEDPAHADAAKAAIGERFGLVGPPDAIYVT